MSENQSSRLGTYKRLLKYAVPFRMGLVMAIVGMISNAGFEALFARLMGPFLDKSFGTHVAASGQSGMSNPQSDMFVIAPIVVIVLFIARGASSFMASYGLAWVGRHVVRSLRQELFEKIIRFPIKEFDRATAGSLISKITFDVELVANSVTQAILVLVRESAYVLFLLFTMFSYSWQLSLVFFLVIPPIAFSVKRVSARFRKLGLKIQTAMGRVTAKSEQMVSGNKVMKLFGSEDAESKQFYDINNNNRQQNMKVLATQGSSDALIQLMAGIGLAAVLYIAGTLAESGSLTVGAFVGLITTMLMMMRPIKRLTNVNGELQRGIAAAESIFSVLDKDIEVDNGTLTIEQRPAGEISFDDVTFRYPSKDDPALKNISFTVPAGQTVALVGRSGSGKTTVSSLLTRFYDIDSGHIRLDGHDLRDYKLSDLRRQFAVVSQQVYLFNDSVAANIAYGNDENVSREDIINAAQTAHAMEFIERLPEGLDTVIGENGVMLSGGQRQRIAIARALLRNSPLLILDEATSALDTESERHIQAGLEALQKDRTSLVIAHRLSTIENADQILVMDNGVIIEQGTHRELLAKDGAYANLYKMQFGS
ncbi:lipid A export permease/ATP-binding protein MsbA [Gallaecimonas mangrovi]|uniref:lipid A export permease/ATP-binding protein MsbA n=1 Tax=Gallaecimonas mangrovi TaxID=2291597 RepID=UPI000E1FF102|nr:lipid A export permease/ATP-binding protein MsbA [Gallaecimonas mangrovi]